MNEWTVFGVIAALVSFFSAVAVPVLRLTRAITALDATVKNTAGQLAELKTDNTTSHRQLWEKNGEQDGRLNDHETRITLLERDKGKTAPRERTAAERNTARSLQ